MEVGKIIRKTSLLAKIQIPKLKLHNLEDDCPFISRIEFITFTDISQFCKTRRDEMSPMPRTNCLLWANFDGKNFRKQSCSWTIQDWEQKPRMKNHQFSKRQILLFSTRQPATIYIFSALQLLKWCLLEGWNSLYSAWIPNWKNFWILAKNLQLRLKKDILEK